MLEVVFFSIIKFIIIQNKVHEMWVAQYVFKFTSGFQFLRCEE